MSTVGFVPVLTFLTLVVVLALVWMNIQQTMRQLDKSRDRNSTVSGRN